MPPILPERGEFLGWLFCPIHTISGRVLFTVIYEIRGKGFVTLRNYSYSDLDLGGIVRVAALSLCKAPQYIRCMARRQFNDFSALSSFWRLAMYSEYLWHPRILDEQKMGRFESIAF